MAAVATLIAGAGPASSTTIPSGFFVVTDAQGANDVPGRVDLTQFGRDDSDADQFKLFWNWDAVGFTSQTGDACALFDYNGNGNIDAAVCSEIHNGTGWSAQNPVITQTVTPPNHGFAGGPPYVFTCSDAKNDRCARRATLSRTPHPTSRPGCWERLPRARPRTLSRTPIRSAPRQ